MKRIYFWMSPFCGNAWHQMEGASYDDVARKSAERYYQDDPCIFLEFPVFVKFGDSIKEFTVKNQIKFIAREN